MWQGLDWLRDASIFYAFDRTGFERHAERRPAFQEPLRDAASQPLMGLVTGGSRGIGQAAVERLRGLGHRVLTCGRSPGGGGDPDYLALDTSDWGAVSRLADELPALDFLALNAGGMPERFETNAQGVEMQMASQLFGHFLLARNLVSLGKLKPGSRIVWMSSGGMYLKRLHLDHLFENEHYSKVETYANVKRAQVVVNREMAEVPEFQGIDCLAMHPGWVDTAGIQAAIPGFWRLTRNRLRTPEQGADTLVWLVARPPAAELGGGAPGLRSGALYFDRRETRAHLFPWTRERLTDRLRLLELLEEQLAPYYR